MAAFVLGLMLLFMGTGPIQGILFGPIAFITIPIGNIIGRVYPAFGAILMFAAVDAVLRRVAAYLLTKAPNIMLGAFACRKTAIQRTEAQIR